ncbi:DHH family phosphoesterase [Spirochaeta isovalerica]|uniref:Single-stranded DNA-specific DHH superfamily exonuclease n=1 Tax=Spirochaeta isovalerica TaxID=150 RepID=A0A841R9V3_9SPIO|nr:DHH family phosphoesterase [Spirochaeta isovalerica]MBB6479790.1 single-stranded DNA-specific DHH superfamily exonuclease [Spirochaeta isovalerica]
MIDDLLKAMKKALSLLERQQEKQILLFHHNDTDGLSSGAVLMEAFNRCGYEVTRYSLEKPYPQVLEKVFKTEGHIIVFADFAGKIAPEISRINKGRNLVIILDHHPAEYIEDDTVFNLDGELHGLKGDRDISASATAFLFSSLLLESRGLSPDSLVHLGVLGAIGDGFFVNGALSGINSDLFKRAEKAGTMRSEKTEAGIQYYIRLGEGEYSADYICSLLDTLGGVAYYSGGTDRGITVCLEGMTDEIREYETSLKKLQNEIFDREKENLSKNLITTGSIQWFDVGRRFEPMGVKMIGVFCTLIKDSDLVDRTRYLAGFQQVPDMVPGFGDIDFRSTKVSMRVSADLTEAIRRGDEPGLSDFLPEATLRLGGFADACHSLSAATTVSIGQERDLINEAEKVLVKRRMRNE